MSITLIANSDRLREAARRYADETGDDVETIERVMREWLQNTVEQIVDEAEYYVHSLNSRGFAASLKETYNGR